MKVHEHSILILEDDTDLAMQWQAAFRDAGYSCDVAFSRIEAEVLCRRSEYTAVVVDVFIEGADGRLEGDGGLTLLNHLRMPDLAETPRWGATVPVVVVTGSQRLAEFDALEHADYMGASTGLRKPFRPESLVAVVRDLTRIENPAAAEAPTSD